MIRTGTVQGSHQGSHLGNKETTAKEGIRYQGIEVFGSKGLEEEILTAKQTQTKPSNTGQEGKYAGNNLLIHTHKSTFIHVKHIIMRAQLKQT